jgi:hypothetical protein
VPNAKARSNKTSKFFFIAEMISGIKNQTLEYLLPRQFNECPPPFNQALFFLIRCSTKPKAAHINSLLESLTSTYLRKNGRATVLKNETQLSTKRLLGLLEARFTTILLGLFELISFNSLP